MVLGQPVWEWPDGNGAVPGTTTVRRIVPGEELVIDRIGGAGGDFFSDPGTGFGARAVPPDRLNFERNVFTVNTHHPELVSGAVRVESSEIAPWFGQRGGGPQHRFVEMLVGEDGEPKLTPIIQADLVRRGIIPDPATQRSAR